jgi:hypothetical protein
MKARPFYKHEQHLLHCYEKIEHTKRVSKSMQNTNLHAQKQSLPYLGDFKKVWV